MRLSPTVIESDFKLYEYVDDDDYESEDAKSEDSHSDDVQVKTRNLQ